MKHLIFFISSVILFSPSVSSADTFYLKDGKVIKGKVVDKTATETIVKEGAFPHKIYNSDIERVELDEPAAGTRPVQEEDLSKITDKRELIVKFLEVNGTKTNLEKNFQAVLAQAPAEKKVKLAGILEVGKVIDMLAPIYEKYFNEEELRELIKFYQSPIGQKFNELGPILMQETLETSVKYFKDNETLLNPSAE